MKNLRNDCQEFFPSRDENFALAKSGRARFQCPQLCAVHNFFGAAQNSRRSGMEGNHWM